LKQVAKCHLSVSNSVFDAFAIEAGSMGYRGLPAGIDVGGASTQIHGAHLGLVVEVQLC